MTLSVGESPGTTIAAHQSLLNKSPYFREHFASAASPSHMSLPEEDLDAVGCFVQYLYTGDYFPRIIKQKGEEVLEKDPARSDPDDGDHLLKHAKVYTLAEKFVVKDLKTMAHKKIHRINSSALGEISYARYVYGNTPREDRTIRGPIAAFWAARGEFRRSTKPSKYDMLIHLSWSISLHTTARSGRGIPQAYPGIPSIWIRCHQPALGPKGKGAYSNWRRGWKETATVQLGIG